MGLSALLLLLLSAGHSWGQLTLDPASGLSIKRNGLTATDMEIAVTINKNTWVALGISEGAAPSMSGGGNGADIVICAEGAVKRYWVTSQAQPTGGVPIPNATCTHANGKTDLVFKRELVAAGAQQRSVVIGQDTSVIWAHGSDGGTSLSYHSSRGGKSLDFGALEDTIVDQAATTTTLAATTSDETDSLSLLGGLTIKASLEGTDKIKVTVKSSKGGWAALGLSAGAATSMTGGGSGVDAFICSNGAIQRHWLTAKSTPSNGKVVEGGTCTTANGVTEMVWTMSVKTEASQERSITLGEEQPIIYAHGAGALAYHGGDRGGQLIDFESMSTAAAAKRPGETTLYLHLICMTLAWGALLPWGAVMANRLRNPPAGKDPASWFKLHRPFQMTGLLLGIVGFIISIAHVNSVESIHFSGPHKIFGVVVTALGVWQAVTAVLRNLCAHRPNEPKTMGRRMFEISHKTGGWIAVICGPFQIISGILLAIQMNYETNVVVVAAILVSLGIGSLLVFAALATTNRENALSKLLTSMVTASGENFVVPKNDVAPAEVGKQEETTTPHTNF